MSALFFVSSVLVVNITLSGNTGKQGVSAMKIFYVFTCLVLLWGTEKWHHLPWWLHLAVFGNLLLALVLIVRQTYRVGRGGMREEGMSIPERETDGKR